MGQSNWLIATQKIKIKMGSTPPSNELKLEEVTPVYNGVLIYVENGDKLLWK
jgi:hypothetical protein